MHVFVAGAAGAIGRRLLPLLIARGHEVTATTRSPRGLDQLRTLGANAVVMDGLDAASVGQAVAHAHPDAIVHQMTALGGKADLRRFDRWFARTKRAADHRHCEPARRGQGGRSGASRGPELHRLDQPPRPAWASWRDGFRDWLSVPVAAQ